MTETIRSRVPTGEGEWGGGMKGAWLEICNVCCGQQKSWLSQQAYWWHVNQTLLFTRHRHSWRKQSHSTYYILNIFPSCMRTTYERHPSHWPLCPCIHMEMFAWWWRQLCWGDAAWVNIAVMNWLTVCTAPMLVILLRLAQSEIDTRQAHTCVWPCTHRHKQRLTYRGMAIYGTAVDSTDR